MWTNKDSERAKGKERYPQNKKKKCGPYPHQEKWEHTAEYSLLKICTQTVNIHKDCQKSLKLQCCQRAY